MSLRLAVMQAPAGLGDVAERLGWLDRALAWVEADLAVCPELFATGYNIGDAVRQRAEPADGPIARALAGLAVKHRLALHCSFAESEGGRIHNAAQCWGADGRRLVHQRKLAIPPGRERDHYAPGAGCALFELMGVRIATLICYDIEFVEPARHVAAMGADLIVVPTALAAEWGWVARVMVPARAYENGVYLAYANHAGVQGDIDFLGESFIAAPDGRELARAGADEAVLLAEIDPGQVARAQARLPYLAERGALRL